MLSYSDSSAIKAASCQFPHSDLYSPKYQITMRALRELPANIVRLIFEINYEALSISLKTLIEESGT